MPHCPGEQINERVRTALPGPCEPNQEPTRTQSRKAFLAREIDPRYTANLAFTYPRENSVSARLSLSRWHTGSADGRHKAESLRAENQDLWCCGILQILV